MTLFGNTALIFALGLLMAPISADIGLAGISNQPKVPVEIAGHRRYPKCSRAKRAPCEMLVPEQESSDTV